MSPELQGLLSVASPILLGIVTWFLRGIASDIKETSKQVAAITTELKLHDARIVSLERELTTLRIVVDDLRGFLASAGFRRRDDP